MKKEELQNKVQLTRDKAESAIEKAKIKIKGKVEEGRSYVKDNPEKTKAVLAGIVAFAIAVVAFLLGRKTKNDENKK